MAKRSEGLLQFGQLSEPNAECVFFRRMFDQTQVFPVSIVRKLKYIVLVNDRAYQLTSWTELAA